MAMRYQPQGLLRLARTPMAGLRAAVLPGVNRGYDAVTGRHPTVVGTKAAQFGTSVSAGFGAAVGVGSTDRITTGLSGAFPATGRSYFFRFRRNGSGGGNLGRLFDKTNGSTGQMMYWSNSASAIVYSSYINGAEQPTFVAGAPVGEWVNLLVTHRQDGTSRVITAYANGVGAENTAFGTPNDAPTTALTIGNRASDGVRGWDGLVECFYVWDRILGPEDAVALSQNRYASYDAPGEDDDLIAAAAVVGSDGPAYPQGVAATASIGPTSASAGASAAPLGVSATAFVGAASATAGTSASASPLGVTATGGVGVANASAGAGVTPAGVMASGQAGAVAATAGALAALLGVSASAQVGAATATGGSASVAAPAGVSAAALVGAATGDGGATAAPVGVSALTQVGIVTAAGGSASTAAPAGVSATASVGQPAATGGASGAPSGVTASASAGQATASASVNGTATPEGVTAAASVGLAAVSAGARCAPAGVAAFASVGAVIAAGSISIPAIAAPVGVIAYARVGTATATGGGIFARAPAGSGYTPQRSEYQSRPVQAGSARPAAIQRNRR